jgi:hypothetical protein
LAAQLPEEERADLARALVRTLPDPDAFELDGAPGFTDAWAAEIRRRLREEPAGEALSFEELRERVDALIERDE